MEEKKLLLDVNEKPDIVKWIVLAIQHVFAMFGATILVPILVNSTREQDKSSHNTSSISYFRNRYINLYIMYKRKITSLFRKFICIYSSTCSCIFKRWNFWSNDRDYGYRTYICSICYNYSFYR